MDVCDEDSNLLRLASASITVLMVSLLLKKQKPRRWWSRPWLQRRRGGRGVLNMLNRELLVEDTESYKNFLRLSSPLFEKLLSLVEKHIVKEDTYMRDSVSARNRLEVTLRFLATGDTYRSLMYATRIHESTISRFVPEVCDAIYRILGPVYVRTPTDEITWLNIAENFYNLWQFPNCLGALDGRHSAFRAPISDGSYYYNYKGYHILILLAMCDAQYKFTYINVGINGRINDGGVFRESKLSKAIVDNKLNFPPSKALPGRTLKVPYVIVGDDAFPLSDKLLKPFPQRGLSHDLRIFNYRLSRARRIIENSFGILANRFRVLLDPINLSVSKVEKITLAAVTLHNYLLTEEKTIYSENQVFEYNLPTLGRQGGNKSSASARTIRDEFKNYFISPVGAVSWQEDSIKSHNL